MQEGADMISDMIKEWWRFCSSLVFFRTIINYFHEHSKTEAKLPETVQCSNGAILIPMAHGECAMLSKHTLCKKWGATLPHCLLRHPPYLLSTFSSSTWLGHKVTGSLITSFRNIFFFSFLNTFFFLLTRKGMSSLLFSVPVICLSIAPYPSPSVKLGFPCFTFLSFLSRFSVAVSW